MNFSKIENAIEKINQDTSATQRNAEEIQAECQKCQQIVKDKTSELIAFQHEYEALKKHVEKFRTKEVRKNVKNVKEVKKNVK